MMFNDDLSDHSRGGRPERERPADHEHGMSDREVPFESHVEIADAVHAWLDGTTPEREVHRAEWSRDVEFWKLLDDDLSHRRRMRTPAGLSARIMSALPENVPAASYPWWRREFVVTPLVAALALLTMMSLTALVTAAVIK